MTATGTMARHEFEVSGEPVTLSYTEWGAADNPRVVCCVHGLTRNARDFDFLAAALAGEFRVICPDVVGRGRSGRLADAAGYTYPTYVAHAVALTRRLGATSVSWLGTSMGGLIGMMLATAQPGLVERLVLNDIGAVVARAGLLRLAGYVGDDPSFKNATALEAYLRRVFAPFGPLPAAAWRHLAAHGGRPLPSGEIGLAYDPAIAEAFKIPPEDDIDLWQVWEHVECPVLLLRGAESDLLGAATADEMTRRGPGARLVEFPGIGHCPMLMDPEQITLVRDWLSSETPTASAPC